MVIFFLKQTSQCSNVNSNGQSTGNNFNVHCGTGNIKGVPHRWWKNEADLNEAEPDVPPQCKWQKVQNMHILYFYFHTEKRWDIHMLVYGWQNSEGYIRNE